jgi:hypothetical protein
VVVGLLELLFDFQREALGGLAHLFPLLLHLLEFVGRAVVVLRILEGLGPFVEALELVDPLVDDAVLCSKNALRRSKEAVDDGVELGFEVFLVLAVHGPGADPLGFEFLEHLGRFLPLRTVL